MILPKFDVSNYNIIRLIFLKMRVLPKCQEKGIQYIERMRRDMKYQWAKGVGMLHQQIYDNIFKRKSKNMAPKAVASLIERQTPENDSSVKIIEETKDNTLLKKQMIRSGDRRY